MEKEQQAKVRNKLFGKRMMASFQNGKGARTLNLNLRFYKQTFFLTFKSKTNNKLGTEMSP